MVLKVSNFFIERDYSKGLKVLRDKGRDTKSDRTQDR